MKTFLILPFALLLSCEKHVNWYERCIEYDQISFFDYKELQNMPDYRTINMGDTNFLISLSEAHRIRYKLRETIFIDVKIEKSQPGHFGLDLRNLFSYYVYLDSIEVNQLHLRHAELGKLSGMILTRTDLNELYDFLSINFFIDYEKERFIYVYYYNMNNHQFRTLSEFEQIRDITLTQIIECLE